MVNLIIWLIAGAFLGGLITLIMRRRRSILLINVVVGGLGAFVGGYLLSPVFHINTVSFSWPGLLVALVSSFVLLAIINFMVREHTMANVVMEDHWDLVQRKIHYRWSKITQEEVAQINSNHDRFISLIEERYGVSKVEAEDQLQKFLRAVVS